MTLFTNPNFIDHIIKSQAADPLITQDTYAEIQALIEIETRLLIETAIKTMDNDRQDSLTLEHVLLAAKNNLQTDLMLPAYGAKYQQKNEQIIRQNKTYTSPEAYFQEQMCVLGNLNFEEPYVKGYWILINQKIPNIHENRNLKSLRQLALSREHQAEEQKKLFNIIKDEGISFLTAEQSEYYYKITTLISSESIPQNGFQVDGDLTRLLPYFLAFVKHDINDTGVLFIIKMLDNKYLGSSIEFHFAKVIHILLAYKGPQSFVVGQAIARQIKKYSPKYPALLQIFQEYEEGSYSTILKKIAFEIELNIGFELQASFLSRCRRDCEDNDQLAMLCMRAILSFSNQLGCIKKMYLQSNLSPIFWLPSAELKADCYLNSL